MATTKNHRSTTRDAQKMIEQGSEQAREITRDVVDYMTEYARENPGYSALICLGAGFVLGWKLKPW